ncbi:MULTISPECIES: hypothetical protein [Streptomyces]|uniref:Uncharacterized protein n=1 Tax=Streptomyces edwardsiae TaxID=3075527 RepID=A0ABU2Q1D3_9ACTN|nr:hypothetical protein [Streptomyces sp. DSM 41636]MDT0396795.1 hypothetical protein [Streptomyces sp. DSM 41636]
MITTKEMITPGQIEPRNDMAIFMEDYGDQLWAFDVDDPTIVLESQPDGSWERCAENLSEFLTHNALHESAHTAPFWRASSNVPDSKLPEILTKMQQVSFNGWLWPRPGHQIFLGEGIIADIGPAMKNQSPWENHRGYTEVQIGATNSELLDHLDEMRDIKWLRPLFG